MTLVAEQRQRVVAAAHLLRYGARRGLATWLVAQAADWLRLARVDRVLDYAQADDDVCRAFLESVGYIELTRMSRGWSRASER